MAAALKALNAKIRSNKYLDYFCSTRKCAALAVPDAAPKNGLELEKPYDFWGPASNFGIPLAAIADMSKDPEIISGPMTGALSVYSAVFMRYALAVSPPNYLLFGCHAINCSSQIVQGYRYMSYWKWGGRDIALKAKEAAAEATSKVETAAKSVTK